MRGGQAMDVFLQHPNVNLVVRPEVLAALDDLPPLLRTRAWLSIEEVFACARRVPPGGARWRTVWGSATFVVAVGQHRLRFGAQRQRRRVIVALEQPAAATRDKANTALPLWRSRIWGET